MLSTRQQPTDSVLLQAVAIVAATAILCMVRPAAAVVCSGDCNRNSEVTVDELITMVNIALGAADQSTCVAGDLNGSDEITVDEIIAGVNSALNGCPPVVGRGVCGDQVVDVDMGEECDDGGICIGGTNAGVACNADSDCQGAGVCDAFGFPGGGERKACGTDADCAGAVCVHCEPFGGDGCAANCTQETSVLFTLKPGEIEGSDIQLATSGAVVHGDILTIPLPLSGTQSFLIGKPRNNRIPVVQKPAFINFPPVPVGTLGCACVRGALFKTCGGTTKEADGVTDSTDCTTDASVCAGLKPCTAVAGPGNSGEGTVACDSLAGINFSITQDAGGAGGTAGPSLIDPQPGSAGPGSALIASGATIGTLVGTCSGTAPDYGPDGEFCTSDDPQAARGTATLQLLTTGMACATMQNANGIDGNDIGPFCSAGVTLSCGELASGTTAGAALAGAFTSVDQPTVGDIAVTSIFVAQ
jgi:hypothetical protein